jgi:hypothetical protein
MPGGTLQTNVPMLVAHFDRVTTLYLKQYGPGNLRLGSDRDSLLSTILPNPLQDGIVQVTADGWKSYFWEGDLWLISDAPGNFSYSAPSYQFSINRGKFAGSPNADVVQESELEGDLSTYGRRGSNRRYM